MSGLNQNHVGSQTDLEDQVDALRINPFLSQRVAKEQHQVFPLDHFIARDKCFFCLLKKLGNHRPSILVTELISQKAKKITFTLPYSKYWRIEVAI